MRPYVRAPGQPALRDPRARRERRSRDRDARRTRPRDGPAPARPRRRRAPRRLAPHGRRPHDRGVLRLGGAACADRRAPGDDGRERAHGRRGERGRRGRPALRARRRLRAARGPPRRGRSRRGAGPPGVLSTDAVLLALAAAVVHAAWTLLLAGAPDSQTATAAALGIAVLVFAPFAALGWDVDAEALPYLAGSALFELGFFATLGLALRAGPVSLVYPLSRGVAPVLVLVVGALALGIHIGAVQAIGVAVIAAGVVTVRGLDGTASTRDTGLALACGGCIAGYTLVDLYGVRPAAPLAYLECGRHRAAPVPYRECVPVHPVAVSLPLLARLRGARAIAAAAGPRIAVA